MSNVLSYNANVVGDTARSRIRDFALQLLAALKAKRTEDDERERPLILVGHSLGGLVAKHAMVTANIDGEFANLKTCCYSLIFMATPHRGSDKANMGKLLANIAKVSFKRPKIQVLRELEANSLLLQDLSDDFRHLHSQFRIASFFEQKETVVSRFMPKIMVCCCAQSSFSLLTFPDCRSVFCKNGNRGRNAQADERRSFLNLQV